MILVRCTGQYDVRESSEAGASMEADDNLWPPFGPGASFGRGRPDPHLRGRNRQRPTLTREEIVAAAIGVADRQGADAVSMRKIAQVLQAGAVAPGRSAAPQGPLALAHPDTPRPPDARPGTARE